MKDTHGMFVRRKELAEIIGVSERTVGNLMQRRAIPYYKVGYGIVLFNVEEVLTALKGFRVRAVGDDL